MALLFSWFSEHVKVALLALGFALRTILVHLVDQLLTATPWDVWVSCLSWLRVKNRVPLIVRSAGIYILTKSGKWILAVQSSGPSATRGRMQNVHLPTARAGGSKQGFFVLPHSHGYALPSSRHIILDSNPNPKIDVLLALSDCVSHVRSPAEVNIPLAFLRCHHSVRVLLLKLETRGPVSRLVEGQTRVWVLLGELPASTAEVGAIRILHLKLSIWLIWRLLKMIPLKVRVRRFFHGARVMLLNVSWGPPHVRPIRRPPTERAYGNRGLWRAHSDIILAPLCWVAQRFRGPTIFDGLITEVILGYLLNPFQLLYRLAGNAVVSIVDIFRRLWLFSSSIMTRLRCFVRKSAISSDV